MHSLARLVRDLISRRISILGLLVVQCLVPGLFQRAIAEEPYQRFLQRLRDEQMFELSLAYLDELEALPGISDQLKADLDLERGMLQYLTAAVLPPSHAQRAQKLDAAERSLREFLQQKKNHPRRGEARLKLGELLLTRAEEAKANGEPGKTNAEAVQFYDAAHQLFETTIQELAGILNQIKGARTDNRDTAKVAYRRSVQQDLRQAQLLSAKAVEERGLSRAEGEPARKADLEKSLKMFSDLYTKEQAMVGIRNYALFYRSEVHNLLGRKDDAIDGFQRIADVEPIDALRPLQSSAINELVKLLAERGKYVLAVDRADRWIASLRPEERGTPEALELQLELVKAKLAWADTLVKKDPEDRLAVRLVRDTRDELRSLLRLPGPHLEEARAMLGQLGVDVKDRSDSTELPKVKDFGEALAEAQQRIDRAETDSLSLEVQRAEGNAEVVRELEDSVDLAQQQAIALLMQAVRLYGADDGREQLFDVRYRLAFLMLKQQRLWESLAIAEFLARRNPSTEKGLRSAAIALGALNDLLRTAGDAERAALADLLAPFADYLVKTWPKSEEAAASAAALVQLALRNQEWDKAEKFLALVPESGDAVLRLRRYAGVMFYAKYIAEKKQSGRESEPAVALRERALKSLEIGTRGLKVADMDSAAIEAVNAQARLLLIEERVDEATQLLMESKASPIQALESKAEVASVDVALESYRTAIQLLISRLATGKLDSKQASSQAASLIGKLQAVAEKDENGSRKLAEIFVGLARDLQAQLSDVSDASKRQRLSQALVIVAAEAAKSDAFNTQYWSADTLITIAVDLQSTQGSESIAKQSYADAQKILQAIMAKEERQPGWIEPAGLKLQIRRLLAKCSSGLGDYKGALNAFAEILAENGNFVDVQMEAASVYQAWADAVNSGFHKAALRGGRPDPKTRQNLIWGWGKISQKVANNPNYTKQFYEARYQLAVSRYKYAVGQKDAGLQDTGIRQAEKDIVSTASLFPQLGGPAMKKKYDALLRVIQKKLGKPQQGLAAIGK